MDNLDESENAKISDSAYSNSCSNSQSRRSHSSTHSGSHSSRSSGYGGKQSPNSSSNHLGQPTEKRGKDKDGKKKKQAQTDLVQIQADVEFRLPKPAMTSEIKKDVSDVPALPNLDQVENGVEDDGNNADIETCEEIITSIKPQSPMQIDISKRNSSDGFSCVISLDDGVVIYSSTSLTVTLGFPKEMWIGRSFIDFIHPLDRNTFASQIASGLAARNKDNVNTVQSPGNSVSTMFCRIRKYRGLSAGFSVTDRTTSFMPFMLKLSFKNINDKQGVVIYLVMQATPMFSAFKTANEILAKPVPFMMRHVANGNLEYIDPESVPLLGYLPQDFIGKDILRLYHTDDLVYMRQIYETIVKEGAAPLSKPYRFMAQNGHYLKLETEWSSFINPWSRKLEFVIGKHHVVEGPSDPDVFHPPVAEKTTGQAKNKAQGLRESIVRIMNEVLTKPTDVAKQHMTKRCQILASFMESLIKEEPTKLEEELRLEIADIENNCERDSVMLGGISPHHDYDSNSSNTTPLSYNRLNFNENLQRYFDSHQQISYDDCVNIAESLTPKDGNTSDGCVCPMAQQPGDSAEATSSGECTSAAVGETSSEPSRLTQSILNKHNSEMEKSLVLQHRECRSTNKKSREKASIDKKKKKDHLARCNASYLPTLEATNVVNTLPHGLKRASKPLETETRPNKHHCTAPRVLRQRTMPSMSVQPISIATSTAMWQQSSTTINPHVSDLGMSQHLSIMNYMNAAVPDVIPIYHDPTTGPALPSTSEMNAELNTPPHFPVSHLQYMMYGQAMFGSPFVVPPFNPNFTYPTQQENPTSSYSSNQDSLGLTTTNYERSTEAAPDSSNSRDSKMKGNRMLNSDGVDRTDGESSYSSFYSSFFKTDSGTSAEDSGDAKKGKNGPHENSMDKVPKRKREPPWMEQVSVTSELVYKYQIMTKDIDEVLSADKQRMLSLHQPSLVNEQLGQLYVDMELEGVASRLTLEEGVTSSGSSGDENALVTEYITLKRTRRKREYGKLVMIYEEDAPMPPPCATGSSEIESTEPASPLASTQLP